jgi:hypothetical protein
MCLACEMPDLSATHARREYSERSHEPADAAAPIAHQAGEASPVVPEASSAAGAV